jgi:nitrous oxidase accessory protein
VQSTLSQPSLQDRVRHAKPGDTLVVTAGVYNGSLEIGKKITLVGQGTPRIRGGGRGSCIVITADSCEVSGFVIEQSGSDLMAEDAGILLKSSHNTVRDNELRDVLFGIYLFQSNHNTVENNTVIGRQELEYGQRGSGIHIWNSRHNVFRGNAIRFTRDGFYFQNSNCTLVERSDVSHVRYGLHYMYADSNTFTLNRFVNNIAGAAIMYSREIEFRHNLFAHNRGFASYGLLFQDCQNVTADSNIIADNQVGMFFEASSGNRFTRNVIAQNDVALEMFQNCTGNLFAANNFIDNLSPLTIIGKRTGSNWDQNGRGNYWSAYDGYDLDGDGIGDVPMRIQNAFQYLEARSPNLRVYLYSPASQALAVATKAFPIITVSEEVDQYPLVKPVDLSALPAMSLRDDTRRSNKNRSEGIAWLTVLALSSSAAVMVVKRLRRGGVS